jgi:hypothetical protein
VRSGQVLYPTGTGNVEILFALNKWVRVSLPSGESVQRQVGKPAELAAILQELGLTKAESALPLSPPGTSGQRRPDFPMSARASRSEARPRSRRGCCS